MEFVASSDKAWRMESSGGSCVQSVLPAHERRSRMLIGLEQPREMRHSRK